MKVLITAFGPFDGRQENASSLALRIVTERFPTVRFRILPVDLVVAPARLLHALRAVQPDRLVMLGEAAGSRHIRLETTAWNEMDFRIPDIAGRLPDRQVVREGARPSLPATLPLGEMHARLQESGHAVELSNDPGRYLCNQIFFTALHDLAARGVACPAGFVHLPLPADYPPARAADALGEMLRHITGVEQLVAQS